LAQIGLQGAAFPLIYYFGGEAAELAMAYDCYEALLALELQCSN